MLTALPSGLYHICAVLDDYGLKCFGDNQFGQCGYGVATHPITNPSTLGYVDLGTGRKAMALSCGGYHTCAILDDGTLKCWGQNWRGQLGLADARDAIGAAANEMGNNLPVVSRGSGVKPVAITSGLYHNCAVLNTTGVKCWGWNNLAQLGIGSTVADVGKTTTVASQADLDFGGSGRYALGVYAGAYHTCAVVNTRELMCWGWGSSSQLGLGNGDLTSKGYEPTPDGLYTFKVNLGTNKVVQQLNNYGS